MEFSNIWIHHLFLLGRFALAAVAICSGAAVFVYVRERGQKKESETENKRIAQVKALGPPIPSYEERMGVRYGPHRTGTPQPSEGQPGEWG